MHLFIPSLVSILDITTGFSDLGRLASKIKLVKTD